MASGQTLIQWTPLANQPPATAYATLDTRNSHPVLDFDASSAEDAVFGGVLPRNYASGGVTVSIHWMATSATTGNVVWTGAWERCNTDLDADSFATGVDSASAAANATSGILTVTTIAFTDGAQIDSLAVGESFRFKVTRKVADAGDDMAGDAEILRCEIKET